MYWGAGKANKLLTGTHDWANEMRACKHLELVENKSYLADLWSEFLRHRELLNASADLACKEAKRTT